MDRSFEKSVKGGTKIKLAAPKSKYVEHILMATHTGEHGVAEVFRTMQFRLRDSTWTIVFKALIIIHMMIREGEADVTLKFLAQSPKSKLAINQITEYQTQGRNIKSYSEYLVSRAKAFGDTKVDYVRQGEGRLKKLTVEKGLLRETEAVQRQIRALMACDFFSDEAENEITLLAFRLVTMDLLALYQVMNEGTINALEHYFEMSHPDAERALNIYKTFTKQTNNVVQYLAAAREFEHATRLEIPKIKHAPTGLASSLEEYLNDKDFDINRRQYLAAQQAKRGGGGGKLNDIISSAESSKPSTNKFDTPSSPTKKAPDTSAATTTAPKGPAPDLIDFFESIEQNQEPLFQSGYPNQSFPQQQQNGFAPQPTGFNPFLQQQQQPPPPPPQPMQQPAPLQPDFTGAGFGGYGPQPAQNFPTQQQQQQQQQQPFGAAPTNGTNPFGQPQQQPFQQAPFAQQDAFSSSSPTPLQPQSTNPFRQSTFGMAQPSGIASPPSATQSPPPTVGLQRQSTNPFARQPTQNFTGFQSIPEDTAVASNTPPGGLPFSSPPQQQSPPPLQAQATGTNPFARQPTLPPAQASTMSPVSSNPTGSTNPFRQSQFVNQQTGQGWQQGPQGTLSGFSADNVETISVFPRPGGGGGGQPQQQQGQSLF